MGFALTTLSTLFALQHPLRGLKRLLAYPQQMPERSSCPGGGSPSLVRQQGAKGVSDFGGKSASPYSGSSANHQPVEAPVSRPLRGNWPFTVRPPSRQTDSPAPLSAPAPRSFLPLSCVGSRRNMFLASLGAEASAHVPAKALKRVSDARSGRLVIAGRMADVCAELDRMAASEALQA